MIQNEIKRIIFIYENDAVFKKLVDDLINDSEDLNSFLQLYLKNENQFTDKLFPKRKK